MFSVGVKIFAQDRFCLIAGAGEGTVIRYDSRIPMTIRMVRAQESPRIRWFGENEVAPQVSRLPALMNFHGRMQDRGKRLQKLLIVRG